MTALLSVPGAPDPRPTLATLLILVDQYGLPLATLGLLVNLLLAWHMFRRAELITCLLGRNGLRALSKVASLVLAAIAVKLIRQGLAALVLVPPG
jgi:multiple antibiotic resistance protein